jgi:hypothetical protein
MLVIGLVLGLFGIGLFCRLIFTLSVDALPFFVALNAGIAALHSGAGVLGGLLAGVIAGVLTLAIVQLAFATLRPITLRAVIAAVFAIPAALAGYHAVLGLTQIFVPSFLWHEVIAWAGAVIVGCMAWARMTILAEPLPLKPVRAARDGAPQVPAAARRVRKISSPYRSRR